MWKTQVLRRSTVFQAAALLNATVRKSVAFFVLSSITVKHYGWWPFWGDFSPNTWPSYAVCAGIPFSHELGFYLQTTAESRLETECRVIWKHTPRADWTVATSNFRGRRISENIGARYISLALVLGVPELFPVLFVIQFLLAAPSDARKREFVIVQLHYTAQAFFSS